MTFDIGGTKKIKQIGYEIESKTLSEKLARDKIFYEETGGGVTFSGGEAALQADFVIETAHYLNELGISSAIDTAGNVPWEILKNVSRETEYFLYDLKTFDDELHKKCTGQSNTRIISNLRHLAEINQKLIMRLIIVPHYNDDLLDVKNRLELVKSLGNCVKRIDILPYHTLGKGKYKSLHLDYPIKTDEKISDDFWQNLNEISEKLNLKIFISEQN